MKKARVLLATTTAALAGFVGGVVVPSSGDAATAPKVYSYTVLGTDSHTLNPYAVPSATVGGGVTPISTSTNDNGDDVLEVGLDLPVGAKVKSVAITHLSCHFLTCHNSGRFVFGYADPATQAGVAVFNEAPTVTPDSTHPVTWQKTGNPITTISAGRRYVLDWHWPSLNNSPSPGNMTAAWYGATFKYTCTAPCHP